MKKVILASALICLMSITTWAKSNKIPKEKEMKAYLMVYHKDDDHSLHAAVSRDGYTFTALNGNKPIVSGDTIAAQHGIRDPHIYRGPDGAFYCALTDLHIFAQRKGIRATEWERDGKLYGWGNNRGLVLMKSWDLINWQHTEIMLEDLDPVFKHIGCAWAPEIIYDQEAKKLMVYFTMRFNTGINRIYYMYVNNDFNKALSKPAELFSYPKSKMECIDADITKFNGKYHLLICHHDGTAGIKQAVSSHLTWGYELIPDDIDQERGGCEAPNVWKRIGTDTYVLMIDIYSHRPHNFGFYETTDFETFKSIGRFNEGDMKTTNFQSPKHGAMVTITEKELERLEYYWK